MKERLRILPMKILAAFSLLMGLFPAFILPGQYLMPNDPAIWYALPGIAFCFGILGYLFPGKLRMVFPILGGALLTAWMVSRLAAETWNQAFLLIPCWILLLFLPPAWGRPTWEEWHAGVWITGVVIHLIGQFLTGRGLISGPSAPLQISFALYTFLLVLTLNRRGLREGMHGAQKAPAALRHRNQWLITVLFILALLAAFWETLGIWVDRVWKAIVHAVGIAVNWLMQLLPVQDTAGGGGGGGMGMLGGLAEDAEPSAFALFMEKVAYVLVVLILLAGLYFVIRILYKKLKILWKKLLERFRRYAASSGEDYVDEAESTLNLDEKAKVLKDRLQRVFSAQSRQPKWEELDGRGRVRRLYQQYLRRRPDQKALTVREAMRREKSVSPEGAQEFTELYEQARYSDHSISAQEADRLRGQIK